MEHFHITWVTHNSRRSMRMDEFKIRTGEPVIMNDEEEIEITRYIAEIVREDKLVVHAYNICRDHVHIVLKCRRVKLSAIVQKLKSQSARKFNLTHGRSISLAGNKGAVVNKRACSLVSRRVFDYL